MTSLMASFSSSVNTEDTSSLALADSAAAEAAEV